MQTDNEIRVAIRQWLSRNRWSAETMLRAMRLLRYSETPATSVLTEYLAERRASIVRDQLLAINRFITSYPRPGTFADFHDVMEHQIVFQGRRREEELIARRMEVEAAREDRRRAILAMEHQPKRIERGVLFGLDKATVAALQGFPA
ncbi:MAG: hypothetical protein DI547_04795 [Sphingobium sp.]|nr:MAG: hypothetical protein DI547_04795 [Sphingobium sp.]